MVDSGRVTATLRLAVGPLRIAHPITVPSAPVPAAAVVPALQQLVNAVVAAAEDQVVHKGQSISCRKGCGACCRQLVPVSRTEGERLLVLVDAMPAERRQVLKARFAAAEEKIREAGLADRAGRSDRELSSAYFALRVPCPFLEEESCSIHTERPLVCREYLVTSAAELCAGSAQADVTPVPVPKVSSAARGLQDETDDWFPLAMLLARGRRTPPHARRRTGPEWIQRFVARMTGH
ncbi:Fe-S-cluster containining protein [Enhydrobacter aerosaccus]|uniref:Fe-S-cluster containining protein n=1 Tax=Enhydrobacter aerosaccus TaxID=225324 RepID=A0A1T4KAZ2_9HYPH|nr:YkgJ family cysteine cluster protein [Enhydrobacter aerosaccus]SJZ39604.1 Fe-S-cluster containining protein [Enhydrobacter aerosaccus]